MSKEEPKAAPAPSLQEASAKLDINIQNLEAKIAKCDEEVRANVAKGAANAMAKQRAMQALQRKKMYEKQKDQLLGTQFNVETLAFQQEQAEITATAVQAMSAGQEQLKKQQGDMSVEKVEKLMDDMAELSAEAQDIQDALAANPMAAMSGVDDDELEAEFARMQEEAAMEKMAGIPEMPAGGYAAPAASAPVADSAVDDEYAKLLASMGAAPAAAALPS